MREGSPVMQAVITAAFAALMFVLVFAAANTDAPGPIAGMLQPAAAGMQP